MTTMSLWSGVVASGRLLGLRLLAKQMLIMTNALTMVCGIAVAVIAIVAYFSGYSTASVLGIWFCGGWGAMIGVVGFVGAYTERAGLLRGQMYCTAPLVLLLLIGGLEAVFWDKMDLKAKAKALGGELGKMSPNSAKQMLEAHFIATGLLALMLMLLILLNLCFTRILVQRISVDGRYYGRLSTVDDDL